MMKGRKNARPYQEIVEQAIALVLQREAGQTPEQALELDRWLQADKRHPAAYARAASTLKLLDEMPTVREQLEEPPLKQTAPPNLLQFPRKVWMSALAASLVLIGALSVNTLRRTDTVAYADTSA